MLLGRYRNAMRLSVVVGKRVRNNRDLSNHFHFFCSANESISYVGWKINLS